MQDDHLTGAVLSGGVHSRGAETDGQVPVARCRAQTTVQVLPIIGQNSHTVNALLVTDRQFHAFVDRHRHVEEHGVTVVPETDDDMLGSYAMVDPAGRFSDNVGGSYTYSDPILERGVPEAIAQVRISRQKFLDRGGRYDWAAGTKLEAMTSSRLADRRVPRNLAAPSRTGGRADRSRSPGDVTLFTGGADVGIDPLCYIEHVAGFTARYGSV